MLSQRNKNPMHCGNDSAINAIEQEMIINVWREMFFNPITYIALYKLHLRLKYPLNNKTTLQPSY